VSRSQIVTSFALADKALAGFSLSPGYPPVGTGPIAPRKRKVKKLKIGTHIFEGILRAKRPPGLSSMGEGLVRISHPISHRTPHYRMGKDSIRLLIAINKRLNFRTQRDSKIRAGIDGNSLGNRWLTYPKAECQRPRLAEFAISEALIASEPASCDLARRQDGIVAKNRQKPPAHTIEVRFCAACLPDAYPLKSARAQSL
jgi:hypothetical protein